MQLLNHLLKHLLKLNATRDRPQHDIPPGEAGVGFKNGNQAQRICTDSFTKRVNIPCGWAELGENHSRSNPRRTGLLRLLKPVSRIWGKRSGAIAFPCLQKGEEFFGSAIAENRLCKFHGRWAKHWWNHTPHSPQSPRWQFGDHWPAQIPQTANGNPAPPLPTFPFFPQ